MTTKAPGGTADLHPRAAQRRDDESGDYRGVESPVGGDPTGNGEGDGQRQRYDADNDPGSKVREELFAIVGLECGEQLGNEHLGR